MARIKAASRARMNDPRMQQILQAGREAKRGWTEERKDQVRAWAAEGVEVIEMARRLGIDDSSIRGRAKQYGIDLRVTVAARYAACAAVLREHYETPMSFKQVWALYNVARGARASRKSLMLHARRLGLSRMMGDGGDYGEHRAKQFAAERIDLIPVVQKMLDDGATRAVIMRDAKLSKTRLATMFRLGEIVRRTPAPKATRVAKPKVAKPPKPKAPRRLPASYVRAAAEPAKPKPTYESVEAWLAAGNAITRCPTVAALPTTATIPEADRMAMAALYAARAEARAKNKRVWRNF